MLCLINTQSLVDNTVCIISTSESEWAGLPTGYITTQGRIPPECAATATGGIDRGAKDIARDLEIIGQLDFHVPRLDQRVVDDPVKEELYELIPRPEDLPTP